MRRHIYIAIAKKMVIPSEEGIYPIGEQGLEGAARIKQRRG